MKTGSQLDPFFVLRTPAARLEWVMAQLRDGKLTEEAAAELLSMPDPTRQNRKGEP